MWWNRASPFEFDGKSMETETPTWSEFPNGGKTTVEQILGSHLHWVKKRPKSERYTVSSWDTNPWSNFCDPHWKLICCNKWYPRTSEISTQPEIAVRTHFYVWYGTKTAPVFLTTDGEASWSLPPGSVSLLLGSTVQPANTYSCIFKLIGQVRSKTKFFNLPLFP